MMRSRRAFPVVSLLVAAVVIEAARPHYGGTLRIETSDASVMRRLNALAFETLIALDPPRGVRPVLATGWQADASYRRWTFDLRRGVMLHDGSALQPVQVAAALQAAHADWQVQAKDNAVVIDAGRSAPDLLAELAGGANAIVIRSDTGAAIGSGPFRIQGVASGLITLRAHDGYWDSRPFVDAIEVRTDRSAADQMTDVEAGRADIVSIQPPDARRLEQRQLRIWSSRPLEVVVLAFEPPLADAMNATVRRAFADAIDRDAIARVALQNRAEPTAALLPSWLTGADPSRAVSPAVVSRSTVAALPPARRTVALRAPASDPMTQAIAQRIAVNARDAGFAVTVQSPAGLGPRFDARFLRIPFRGTTPTEALTDVMTALGSRTLVLAGRINAPEPGSPRETALDVERALLASDVVVPIVTIPELYAVSPRTQTWNGPLVSPSGAWNLADVWLTAP